MAIEHVETLVIGGGQAGLAMSAHLARRGLPHLVLERGRVAERWRSERWNSLVANGPAWHDRFPAKEFALPPDTFASRDDMVRYFEEFAEQIGSPLRCGVAVEALHRTTDGFRADTSAGPVEARNVVVATGPFQRPLIPALVPADEPVLQLHSAAYRSPDALPPGGVLVVGAGSSGSQIADELQRAGRAVTLAVGPHHRPPRRYRGRDYCWWLGALGKWEVATRGPGTEHVTLAVSGARGGETVDFRRMAARGLVLAGTATGFADGAVHFADDLARNIADGDDNHHSVLDEADAHALREGLDLPDDPAARHREADPACLTTPIRQLDLRAAGIGTIVWATGYQLDFGWLRFDALDDAARPRHDRGVSPVPGLYFLGLPWLTNRSSSFIWGVWRDADELGGHIAAHRATSALQPA